jgi:excinuclease UvrABC helicase subunit UvrB
MEILDFVAEHADSEDLAMSMQQFRPQVMMLQTRALATQRLIVEDYRGAITIIEEGIEQFREFYTAMERPELVEQSMEIQSLQQWLEEVNSKRPLSKRERLEMDLDEAVQNEDYEKAARVRDALKNLKGAD